MKIKDEFEQETDSDGDRLSWTLRQGLFRRGFARHSARIYKTSATWGIGSTRG